MLKTFDKHIGHPSTRANHTYFCIVILQHTDKSFYGKLTTLIAAKYLGSTMSRDASSKAKSGLDIDQTTRLVPLAPRRF